MPYSTPSLAPGSLLKRRANQIAEQNHVYTWNFVHSAKNCQLENELVSVDYTSKVGEEQFSDVRCGVLTDIEFCIRYHCVHDVILMSCIFLVLCARAI